MSEHEKFEAWYRATFKTPSFLSDGVGGYHSDLTERAWLAWAAARSALALEAVPTGFVMVPKEPSAEMIYRGGEATSGHVDWDGPSEADDDAPYRLSRAVYAAMLAAAPQPQDPKDQI